MKNMPWPQVFCELYPDSLFNITVRVVDFELFLYTSTPPVLQHRRKLKNPTSGCKFMFWNLFTHRRSIKTDEKAKVVAFVWGEEFIKFLAALAILPRTIWKNRMNSSFSFKSSWCNSSYYSNRPSAQ